MSAAALLEKHRVKSSFEAWLARQDQGQLLMFKQDMEALSLAAMKQFEAGGGESMTQSHKMEPSVHVEIMSRMRQAVNTSVGMTTGLNLVPVGLASPAMQPFNFAAPWRGRFPRSTVGGTGWTGKRITGIDTAKGYGFVAEPTHPMDTNRGRVLAPIAFSEDDVTYVFKTIGCETAYTMQAMAGANSKIDGAKFNAADVAKMALQLAFFMREERALIGANPTAIGVANIGTPTKVGVAQQATTVGSLTPATPYFIRISALSYLGLFTNAAGRGAADAPGETGGSTANTSISTAAAGSAGDESITIKWGDDPMAFAYNVYVGTANGNEKYYGTFPTSTCCILSLPGAGNGVNTADQTADTNAFVGILPQLLATGSGAYVKSLLGADLTAENYSIKEIEDAFFSIWQGSSIAGGTSNGWTSPDEIFVNARLKKLIDAKIGAGSAQPALRINLENGDSQVVSGAVAVDGIYNRFINNGNRKFKLIPITVHPMFPDMICGIADTLGPLYPNPGIPNVIEVMCMHDAVQFEFAQNGLFWPFGLYATEAPVIRIAFPHMIVRNVGPIVTS